MDATIKLLQDAKRCISLEVLPVYANTYVRSLVNTLNEIHVSSEQVRTHLRTDFRPEQERGQAAHLTVLYLACMRIKRCLMAYHRARLDRIDEAVCAGRARTDAATTARWTPDEHAYALKYAGIVDAYASAYPQIDLYSDLEPPKDLYVDVRVLKDAGEIQTEFATLILAKNAQFFVRKVEVERLIAQGYLEVVR